LENAARESAVHVELVLADSSKLHVYFIIVIFINQLEVLNTSFVNSTVKVEYKCLNLFIPFGWFVEKEHYIIIFVISKFTL